MPPVTGDENDLSSLLKALIDFEVRVGALDPRENVVEVHDGLVILIALQHVFAFHSLLGFLGLEKYPSLHSVRDRVPRGGAQGVNVHRGPGALRPDAEPPERRPGVRIHQGEPVVREEAGHLVVVHERPDVGVIVHVSLKEVQRIVVLLVPDVIRKVLELHPQFLAVVIFGDLEGDVAEPLLQGINRPSFHGRPMLTAFLDDDRLRLAPQPL
mmetsp:Transcript_19568/g.44354  ORF Transcript_19568/g.44354 Transcript_19568/m.44354 type:complete len:212 (-) Transcript_19568:11-646(-)